MAQVYHMYLIQCIAMGLHTVRFPDPLATGSGLGFQYPKKWEIFLLMGLLVVVELVVDFNYTFFQYIPLLEVLETQPTSIGLGNLTTHQLARPLSCRLIFCTIKASPQAHFTHFNNIQPFTTSPVFLFLLFLLFNQLREGF